MIPINQRNLVQRSEEHIDIDGFTYRLTTYSCPGCAKYSAREPHIHHALYSDTAEETLPRHQGQQMMAEFKDVDIMTENCKNADNEGYCDCFPSYAYHSPMARKLKMAEFGVEWCPDITF